MHANNLPRETIELLLAAVTSEIGTDGQIASFGFGKPGRLKPWEQGVGATIYYHPREMILASLHLRTHGPSYLRSLSVGAIRALLQDFLQGNYWYLADEVWARDVKGSFALNVSDRTKSALADALVSSSIIKPTLELTLYPLLSVRTEVSFTSNSFFILSPQELGPKGVPVGFEKWTRGEVFPPLVETKGRQDGRVVAWLGVHSPIADSADKDRAAILGAVSLTTPPEYRYQTSMRRIFGGRCSITKDFQTTTSWGAPHTPSLSQEIVLTDLDYPWLSILASKIDRSDETARRQMRSLEYLYRAWFLEPSDRFAVLCMALDAVHSHANAATQAVIDGVRHQIGAHVPEERLRKLMKLRASVIHGGAPDVYESSKYAEYYLKYMTDPIYDLEVIVATSIRKWVFVDQMREHPNPYAELIREHQAKGHLPLKMQRGSILDVETSGD